MKRSQTRNTSEIGQRQTNQVTKFCYIIIQTWRGSVLDLFLSSSGGTKSKLDELKHLQETWNTTEIQRQTKQATAA